MIKRIHFESENDFKLKNNKINELGKKYPFIIIQVNRNGIDYFDVTVTRLAIGTDEMISELFSDLELLF